MLEWTGSAEILRFTCHNTFDLVIGSQNSKLDFLIKSVAQLGALVGWCALSLKGFKQKNHITSLNLKNKMFLHAQYFHSIHSFATEMLSKNYNLKIWINILTRFFGISVMHSAQIQCYSIELIEPKSYTALIGPFNGLMSSSDKVIYRLLLFHTTTRSYLETFQAPFLSTLIHIRATANILDMWYIL